MEPYLSFEKTGGLQDTVKDFGDAGGYGVTFLHATVGEITTAIYRAVTLYEEEQRVAEIRKQIMELDFSWNRSAQQYIDVYQSVL